MGFHYESFSVINKFIDSLSNSIKSVTTPLRVTHTLKNFDLASLYGALLNHEKFEEMLARNMKDNQKASQVANTTLVVAKPKRKVSKAMVAYKFKAKMDESEADKDEEENE